MLVFVSRSEEPDRIVCKIDKMALRDIIVHEVPRAMERRSGARVQALQVAALLGTLGGGCGNCVLDGVGVREQVDAVTALA
jgi:hypothetical protein